MKSIRSAIENTVSISLFNKGLAGKIFDEVKLSGAKVVMKNNSAECVLLSPEEYLHLLDSVNEMKAVVTAVQRLSSLDPSTLLTEEEFAVQTSLDIGYVNSFSGVDFE